VLNLDGFIQQNYSTLMAVFNNIPDLLFLMSVGDDGKFRYVLFNPAAMKAAKLTADVYGRTIDDSVSPERAQLLNAYYREAASTKKVVTFVEDLDGSYGETVLSPILDERGNCTHVLAITRDITVHEMYQRQLTHLAYHDPLTGLPNRRHLFESLKTLEAGAKERGRILTVMFMDCDTFKSINDVYGHGLGDEFLVALSKRLKNGLRQADILCRLGGDEFVAVAAVDHVRHATSIGQRVLHSMSRPWTFGTTTFRASISIGIAFYPTDGPDLERVIQKADQALQAAKHTGGNRYVVYQQLREGQGQVVEL
jgi:diguanylate cyclase (GGDEF)-like protein/PAS domain S-box-containing protein